MWGMLVMPIGIEYDENTIPQRLLGLLGPTSEWDILPVLVWFKGSRVCLLRSFPANESFESRTQVLLETSKRIISRV